jgi:hypothetical protein
MRVKLYPIARKLRRAATLLGDIDALASRDPVRIGKRAAKKWISRQLHHITRPLFKW